MQRPQEAKHQAPSRRTLGELLVGSLLLLVGVAEVGWAFLTGRDLLTYRHGFYLLYDFVPWVLLALGGSFSLLRLRTIARWVLMLLSVYLAFGAVWLLFPIVLEDGTFLIQFIIWYIAPLFVISILIASIGWWLGRQEDVEYPPSR